MESRLLSQALTGWVWFVEPLELYLLRGYGFFQGHPGQSGVGGRGDGGDKHILPSPQTSSSVFKGLQRFLPLPTETPEMILD